MATDPVFDDVLAEEVPEFNADFEDLVFWDLSDLHDELEPFSDDIQELVLLLLCIDLGLDPVDVGFKELSEEKRSMSAQLFEMRNLRSVGLHHFPPFDL